jgi:hypothetical protein
MLLELADREAVALARALDAYLPELAEEAARCDRQPDAHELWDMYRALQAIRAALAELIVPDKTSAERTTPAS